MTDWETRYYEAEALHTESNGMLTAENERLRRALSDATTRIEALEAENARLRHRVEAYREDIKEIERDAREAIAEAVSEARYQERTGDPYGTY